MSDETYKDLIEAFVESRSHEVGTKYISEAFENVANSLILEPYDLSVDEIDSGVTDGGGDGQVDAMYVLVNGYVLTGEPDETIPEKGPIEIDVILIQSKYTDGFEENPLKIIRTTVADLIKLKDASQEKLSNYSGTLQEKFALARKALLSSAGRTAKIRVRVFYATKASTKKIHSSVQAAATALQSDLSSLTATPDVQVVFLGAEELIKMSRLPKMRRRDLDVHESLSSDSGDSFACLVTLESLVKFLSDEKGDLIRGMFDANVRDFLGKTEVNDAIRSTLNTLESEDFWWFNNGITIVSTEIDQKGKKLVISEPLLVNGLQTSNVIFSFMSDAETLAEVKERSKKLMVLVKIIVPPSEKVRDDVIKATNSQTHIPKPYLRGMDLVHRNIEDHLKASNMFYERRKNQYKNLGKSRSTIVTLSEMAQALMAALLFRGGDARGRPNSLLKSDDDYQSLFSESYALDTFKNVVIAKRQIIIQLIEQHPDKTASFRNDVVYHVLAYVSAKRAFNVQHAASIWKSLTLSKSELKLDIDKVVDAFADAGGTDRVAKSPSFQKRIKALADEARQMATVLD